MVATVLGDGRPYRSATCFAVINMSALTLSSRATIYEHDFAVATTFGCNPLQIAAVYMCFCRTTTLVWPIN
jgi:hypothetical protein